MCDFMLDGVTVPGSRFYSHTLLRSFNDLPGDIFRSRRVFTHGLAEAVGAAIIALNNG